MATQRMTVATLIGRPAALVAGWLDRWRATPDDDAIADFCRRLRANAASLEVVYFAEWIDRWSMGDTVPGPGKVVANEFDVTCLSVADAGAVGRGISEQFDENEWFRARLAGATAAHTHDQTAVVVVVREVLGPVASEGEILAAARAVPGWLGGHESGGASGAASGS